MADIPVYFSLDSNQLSLIFVIQESVLRAMGDAFAFSDLKVFGPFFVPQEVFNFQDIVPNLPDLLTEEKTCFQFSTSVVTIDNDCEVVISIFGFIIGFFDEGNFYVEEAFLNDGSQTYIISFLEKSSAISDPVSFH